MLPSQMNRFTNTCNPKIALVMDGGWEASKRRGIMKPGFGLTAVPGTTNQDGDRANQLQAWQIACATFIKTGTMNSAGTKGQSSYAAAKCVQVESQLRGICIM